MPLKDTFHDLVREALEKDGWIITDDPLTVRYGGVNLYIDLGAETLLAAEKESRKIAVEIKSFIGASPVADFHMALGQYINYRVGLDLKESERILYLAVPVDVYDSFFVLPFVEEVIQQLKVRLMVYDYKHGVIVKWLA